MRGRLQTAGEIVDVDCRLDWVWSLLLEAAGGGMGDAEADSPASVRLVVEADRRPFTDEAAVVLTRGASTVGGAVVFDDVCASGFSLRVEPRRTELFVTARYRPGRKSRMASAVLRSRFHLIARAVLLQYPVLWWAGVRGRAPLHVSALTTTSGVAMLAGPGGVGKSTLLCHEVAAGAVATCDNLAVSDGVDIFGMAEPIRTAGGTGRRVAYGRREAAWSAPRARSLRPEHVVVVRLRDVPAPTCEAAAPEMAARSLITGTFMAGELRRYWAFGATLAAGTGLGPAQPAVDETAQRLVATLPCCLLTLSRRSPAVPGGRAVLSEMLASELHGSRR
jgi:hypothetical protein